MSLFRCGAALCSDDRGVVVSIELILVMTVAIIGLLAGLSAYRDGLVSEIDDAAASIGQLNQSYRYNEITVSGSFGAIPYEATVDGSAYQDGADVGEDPADAIVIDASTIQEEG